MREAQRARGEKPRYDGRWRPEPGKVLPAVPSGVPPVVRFRNPADGGVVSWNDLVKGPISISNRELDDLVIARADGTPTYNFCVVVDDWDMRISHVIRGDDHVNNTPRQINILRALSARALPVYGHVPMILGPDGDKLSKRHGAVSVTQYEDDGYLPEAMLNYLARLGWSHGDDRALQPRAAGRLVRRPPPGQEPGAVGPGQAELGQRPLPEAARTMRALAELVAGSWRGAASRPPPDDASCPAVRAVQGPLRHHGRSWPTGSACTSSTCTPAAETGRACHRRGEAAVVRAARPAGRRRSGTRRRSPRPSRPRSPSTA